MVHKHRKRNITIQWYADTEYAYSDSGVDEAKVFKTETEAHGYFYEITVYPMKLISEKLDGWDYRMTKSTKDGEIIEEYDAGSENYRHFNTISEAKEAAISTLEDDIKKE